MSICTNGVAAPTRRNDSARASGNSTDTRASYQDCTAATVTGLPGVIATGKTLEICRDQLVEVIEEWLLVRVAQGLRIPRLGTATVQVKRTS